MKLFLRVNVCVLFLSISFFSSSQNNAMNWYFGNQAGLNFSTTPPTILTNNASTSNWACATESDNAGNLLFYTNGATIYDKTHAIMANGNGLMTNGAGSQGALIVKKPGSPFTYYVFHTWWNNLNNSGLYYTEVDMSLAAGNGSVVAKNTLLASGGPSVSLTKLTGTRHCNGTDIWVTVREWFNNTNCNPIIGTFTVTNNFHSFLVSPTGVNPTPVTSAAASYSFSNWNGCNSWDYGGMKISPNGKKLALAYYNTVNNNNNNINTFELYDFDNNTGVVSNSLVLMGAMQNNWNYGWGVEFSPDGTKLYGTRYANVVNNPGGVFQWDLCAGSPQAVAASIYTVYSATPQAQNFATLQLAPNGKIYCARNNALQTIDVINNPNAAGAGCNFVLGGQSIAPKTSWYTLPNFMGSNFVAKPIPAPFTHTVSNQYGCQSAMFTTTYNPGISVVGCAATGYSLNALQWNFGDLASGASNTASSTSPVHAFTNLGQYTVSLILYYSCGGGTDTLRQVVNINQPCISVSSTSITCANLGSATVQATGGIGPYSYTWMPSNQTNSVATGLSPGTYTLRVFDFGNNFTYTATTHFTSLIPLTGNLNHPGSVTCNGASTATANVTNIAGGSGTVSYVWKSQVGGLVYTADTPSLSAGIWSVTVSDVLTGCQINQTFLITQPPALNILMATSHPTICAGKTAINSATVSGGTPKQTGTGYTYQWSGGPTTYSRSTTEALAGNYTYSITARDSLSCPITGVVVVDVIPNPTLSVSNVSICPLAVGVLNVSGASTYTWSDNTNNNFLSASPLTSTQYTVIGSAQACTNSATPSIILKPTPFAVLNHNAPICEGKNLNLQGLGGIAFAWSGPLGYSSSAASPVISSAYPAQSGIYEVTVTAANSCTASAMKTVSIHPTPTISVAGSTVCSNQSLNLYAASFPGASFLWKGPVSFTSSAQNPVIALPATNRTGNYTVQVTSANGCIGSASAHASVTALPTPTITSNSPKCFGTTLNLAGTSGETYTWNGPNSFASSLQNPLINGVTLAANGVYNLQITLGPCVTSTSHSVTIFPLPSFTVQSNSPVCETKTLNLTAQYVSNAVSYTWFGPAGFVKLAQNTERDNSVLMHSGTYTLLVKDLNSCQNTSTISVVIHPNPVLTTFSSTVCLNAPATLSVTGASTYYWQGPGFYQSSLQGAVIPSALSPVPTTYTVTGTAVNGCTSIATANLETLPLPQPYIRITPSQRLCEGKSFTLEGNGGVYYMWRGPDNLTLDGYQHIDLIATSALFSGIYSLTAIDAKGCGALTTMKVQIDPLPGGDLAGSRMKSCVPFESQFTYLGKNDETVITKWLLNGNEISENKSFSRRFTVPGDYIITGILTNTSTGCVNTNTYLVNAYPVPEADFTFTPQKPVEGLDEVQLINTTLGESQSKWSWYLLNDEGPKLEGPNKAYLFERTGVYPIAFVVENKWGCGDTMIKAIRIEPDFNVFVPNAFTPNSDSNNESFLPVCTGVKLYEMKVFDRWGKLLFQTTELDRGWDGTYNGSSCKQDTYVWKIDVSSHSGEMKKLSGHVTLIR